MKIIRASEIGTYLYCQRAWWYSLQGVESANQAELTGGSELHQRHGRQVMAAGCLRTLAFLFLLASVGVLTAWVVQRLLA